MKVKLFTNKSGWRGGPEKQFVDLEGQINGWLESHPEVIVTQAHMLSQPTFGWGHLGVAIWYSAREA